jgi:hypothetical protein
MIVGSEWFDQRGIRREDRPMRIGTLLGLGMAAVAMSATPALADWDRGRGWHGWSHSRAYHFHPHSHHYRGHHYRGPGWHRGRGHHYGPPVVYAPPPRVIYAPPHVIYAPPHVVVVPGYGYPVWRAPYGELSIGLNVPLGR